MPNLFLEVQLLPERDRKEEVGGRLHIMHCLFFEIGIRNAFPFAV